MIPRAHLELDPAVPDDYLYELPSPEELEDEDGFGGFRDTWRISGVLIDEAREIIEAELELVAVANRLSRAPNEFEAIAVALEDGDNESLPSDLLTPQLLEVLKPHLTDDPWPFEGLDLGVAGIVAALNAVGCPTAASCRGHPEPDSWSLRPIVYFAADRHHARVLADFLPEAGCGFAKGRSDLLALEAPSIVEMSKLARMVIDAATRFRAHPR